MTCSCLVVYHSSFILHPFVLPGCEQQQQMEREHHSLLIPLIKKKQPLAISYSHAPPPSSPPLPPPHHQQHQSSTTQSSTSSTKKEKNRVGPNAPTHPHQHQQAHTTALGSSPKQDPPLFSHTVSSFPMCVWLSVTLCERQSPIHSTLTYSMKSDHITSLLSIPSFCLAPGGVTNTTITTTHIPTERTPLGHPLLPPPLILIVLTSFYAMLSRLLVLLVFIIIFVSATPFPNSQRHTDGRTDKRTDG